jgi:hypothetical protein
LFDVKGTDLISLSFVFLERCINLVKKEVSEILGIYAVITIPG